MLDARKTQWISCKARFTGATSREAVYQEFKTHHMECHADRRPRYALDDENIVRYGPTSPERFEKSSATG